MNAPSPADAVAVKIAMAVFESGATKEHAASAVKAWRETVHAEMPAAKTDVQIKSFLASCGFLLTTQGLSTELATDLTLEYITAMT